MTTNEKHADRLALMVRCLSIPLREDVAAMEAGIAALRRLPDHDNHHNAAACPYCIPSAELRAALKDKTASEALDVLTGANKPESPPSSERARRREQGELMRAPTTDVDRESDPRGDDRG